MNKSNSDLILDAIKDLHAQEQIVTRETLAEVTGLKMTVIDDRVALMIDNGVVHRVQRGVYVPAPEHKPARIITQTLLPGGTIKLEIGDDHVIALTPREGRMVGQVMSGCARQYTEIEAGHQAAVLAAELAVKLRKLQLQVNGMRAMLTGNGAQLDLLADEDKPVEH
jgi:hypothetical protein